MKKVTLFLISLSFFCTSFVQAQVTSFSYTEDSEPYILSEVEILISPKLNIRQPLDVMVCDDLDGNVDGVTEFDLTSFDNQVSTDLDVTITYHTSQSDAYNGIGAIENNRNYESAGETIYVRAENTSVGNFETTSFYLGVNLIPLASFDSEYSYEFNPNDTSSAEIRLVPTNFTAEQVSVKWYLNNVRITGESNLILSSLRAAGDYTAIITFNSTGCQSTALSAKVVELQSTVFPQGISPDSSPGLNDSFDLSTYDVTKLEIFNRNGIVVYSKSNYTNEWIGQSNSGEELPVGTYFYSMEFDGGTKKRSAWVYLNR